MALHAAQPCRPNIKYSATPSRLLLERFSLYMMTFLVLAIRISIYYNAVNTAPMMTHEREQCWREAPFLTLWEAEFKMLFSAVKM